VLCKLKVRDLACCPHLQKRYTLHVGYRTLKSSAYIYESNMTGPYTRTHARTILNLNVLYLYYTEG